MKAFLKFLAMALLSAVAAVAAIAIASADPQATTSNIVWSFIGTVAFVLAALVNPFRKEEEAA